MRVALVLAGGTGTRLGEGVPKQYREVDGKPVIQYLLDILGESEDIGTIRIVADEVWHAYVQAGMNEKVIHKFSGFSLPGQTRQLSVLNGLGDIANQAEEAESVMILDAARPLLSEQLISDCYRALEGHEGVLPVLPMKDTVYFSENGTKVTSLLERPKIYAGQAPELFVFQKYYEANLELGEEEMKGICGSTEPAIKAGMDVVMIPGDEMNFKITTMTDLVRFEEIMNGKKDAK